MNIEYVIWRGESLPLLFQKIISFGDGVYIGKLNPPSMALASGSAVSSGTSSLTLTSDHITRMIRDSEINEDTRTMKKFFLRGKPATFRKRSYPRDRSLLKWKTFRSPPQPFTSIII
jgi:hypothetical protein